MGLRVLLGGNLREDSRGSKGFENGCKSRSIGPQ